MERQPGDGANREHTSSGPVLTGEKPIVVRKSSRYHL
jgi:hypothetical protein